MNVLVAGGAGYIGSHTVKRLKEAGHSPVIYDNLTRGHREVIDILKVPSIVGDLNDKPKLIDALRKYKIDTVMHFAAYAYVGESVEHPLMYYHNDDRRAGGDEGSGRRAICFFQHMRNLRQSGSGADHRR